MQTDKVTMFGKIASLCRLFRASQVSSLYLKEYFMFLFYLPVLYVPEVSIFAPAKAESMNTC